MEVTGTSCRTNANGFGNWLFEHKLNGPKAGLGFAFGSELGLFFTPCGNSPLEALRKVWTFHQAVSAHIKFTASSYYS